MIVSLMKSRSALLTKTCSPGFTYLGAGVGVKMNNAGDLRITNGVQDGDGLGGIFFDNIDVRETRSSGIRTFGAGKNYFMPRASYRIRSVETLAELEHRESPRTFTYGGKTYPFAASLRNVSAFWDYGIRPHGMWECMGERQPDTGGMKGIEPMSGFQASAQNLVRRSDAISNRTPLDCCDHTGKPLLVAQIVNDDRGYQKTTQITALCKLVDPHNPYNDNRLPVEWNAGSCSYHDDILGLNRYDGELPANQQHGIRTLAANIAAAKCGDVLAQDDLDFYANDGLLAQRQAPVVDDAHVGLGSYYYGTRAAAWREWAWQHSALATAQAQAFVVQYVRALMGNGFVQNMASTGPWSPTPASFGIAANKNVTQIMEFDFTLFALGALGRLDLVRAGCQTIFESDFVKQHKYVPKYAVVAVDGNVVPHVTEWAGDPGFSVWILLGVIAALDPNAIDWKQWACAINYPGKGRPAGTLAELARWLREYDPSNVTRSQTVMLLSVLETLGL